MAEGLKTIKKKKNKFKNGLGPKKLEDVAESVANKSTKPKPIGKKNKTIGPKQPLVKHHEGQKWFEYQVNEKVTDVEKDTLGTAEQLALEEEADVLLRTDVDLYNQHVRTQGGSEASWLLSVIKKGTASDRMTAMQLQMHTSPVHSLTYMEIMIGSLERKNTREALEILPILEEIFLNHFLPSDRKLVAFSGRPLKRIGEICSNSENGRRRLLILWRFEHRLKIVYERFLRAVEGLASLVVEDLSKRALKTAVNLLAERPEGERYLLSLLVNKMGHPKPQIGSFVASLLEDLTKRQPKMRSVIVTEVERLIYRSNLTLRTGDSALAVQLLSIYFGLFKTLVSRKLQDNRLIGILLAAANRALPFAKERADALANEIDTLYKIAHTSSYSVSLQTLKLLFQAATCATPSLAAGILILISRLLESRKSLIVLQKQVDRVALIDAKTVIDGDDEEERYFDVGPDGKPIITLKKEEEEVEETKPEVDAEEKKKAATNGTNFVSKPGWDGCINYKGDPLEDFTLLKFLDRFAFKNPKEGRSGKSTAGKALRKKQFDPWGVKKLSVSSKEYLTKKVTELPADEHYLHRFASMKFNPDAEKEKKDEDDWEIESVDSAEFDAIIDKFEPGEANEEFDVDFSKEFTAEKRKLKGSKRPADDAEKEEDGEDDEVDFEMDDDEEEDEDDEDAEGVEDESDSEDDKPAPRQNNRRNADFGDSDESEDEMGGNDAEAAGEKPLSVLPAD
ncbi:unnamed protein product [Nippostrongylus brasiliensis]|uniref:CCAAT/enhancer-binding protein zeta (inferred by orthology to a human protein) n=1 Tax=Nippostrongylus brasiliensis TaxID=27835 RepID=A0A0N4YGR7_NIPBR|nr:unnamed protein product [Nippostrongylus brasiliensis]